MARSKKYYFDLHNHTSRHSQCSVISPKDLIARALQRGLDGIALTEHGYTWSREEIEELKDLAGQASFPVISGCEISTQIEDRKTGDLLVFGVTDFPKRPCQIDEVCRIAHQQGGIVIAVHPCVDIIGIGDEIHTALIDGIEVANHRYYDPDDTRRLKEKCRELNLTPIASSDAHSISEIGSFCIELDEMIETEQDLVAVIREGRCRPRTAPPPGRFGRLIREWL